MGEGRGRERRDVAKERKKKRRKGQRQRGQYGKRVRRREPDTRGKKEEEREQRMINRNK